MEKSVKYKFKFLSEIFFNIISYSFILLLISKIFNTIYIDEINFIMYTLIASVIIYILNKTIKPLIFELTIPITGITMGLFYPCINIIILKITDIILSNHFETKGIFSLFFTVILISIFNVFINGILSEPALRRIK